MLGNPAVLKVFFYEDNVMDVEVNNTVFFGSRCMSYLSDYFLRDLSLVVCGETLAPSEFPLHVSLRWRERVLDFHKG